MKKLLGLRDGNEEMGVDGEDDEDEDEEIEELGFLAPVEVPAVQTQMKKEKKQTNAKEGGMFDGSEDEDEEGDDDDEEFEVSERTASCERSELRAKRASQQLLESHPSTHLPNPTQSNPTQHYARRNSIQFGEDAKKKEKAAKKKKRQKRKAEQEAEKEKARAAKKAKRLATQLEQQAKAKAKANKKLGLGVGSEEEAAVAHVVPNSRKVTFGLVPLPSYYMQDMVRAGDIHNDLCEREVDAMLKKREKEMSSAFAAETQMLAKLQFEEKGWVEKEEGVRKEKEERERSWFEKKELIWEEEEKVREVSCERASLEEDEHTSQSASETSSERI